MKMVRLLYNLRARTVGITQIKNVFMRHLDVNANNDMNMMEGCLIYIIVLRLNK